MSIRTVEDITKLPVTSKKTYIGLMTEEYISSERISGTYWYTTSGTSGIPLTFLTTQRGYLPKYVNAATLRFLWWRGEWHRNLSTIKMARIKIRGPASKYRFFFSVKDFQSNPREAIASITEFDPEIVTSYPSILLEMARILAKDPTLPRPKPRFIISFGEMVFPAMRRFIEETFGAELYDRYALEEIGAVGLECAAHDGFHINSESVVVEVTDDAYRPLSPGTEGRIVLTDLFNYAMPFIRYDTGDRGVISFEKCPCGLHTPRLWIKGRYSGYLSFPSRRIHHLEFDAAMDTFMNSILQYQIAKKSEHEIHARIIPGPAFEPTTVEKIKENLEKLLGPGILVFVKIVSEIPLTPRGKSRIVVDEVN